MSRIPTAAAASNLLTTTTQMPANVVNPNFQTTGQSVGAVPPDNYTFKPGPSVGWDVVESELFDETKSTVSRKHWFNYFLSKCSNRYAISPEWSPDRRHAKYTRSLYDFYNLASQPNNLLLLTEDARCNLICHSASGTNNRDKNLCYFLALRAKGNARTAAENQIALSEATWASIAPLIRDRIFSLAVSNAHALHFLLVHYTFVNVDELNNLITQATFLDFRIGRSNEVVSVRTYIEFLNTLTPQNRLIYLQSAHPLNASVWDQIPKLENFTVGQSQCKYITVTAKDGKNDRKIILPSDETASAITLKDYAEQLKNSGFIFTSRNFLEMRGNERRAADFVRVNCDEFSLGDFFLFITPAVSARDSRKINGILACFFNSLMRNPSEILSLLDSVGAKPNKNEEVLKTLYSTSETFQTVIMYAREAAHFKKTNQQGTQQSTLQTSTAASAQVSKNEFVIITDGQFSEGLTAENCTTLIESARKHQDNKNYKMAVIDFIRSLNYVIKQEILEEAIILIAKYNLDEFRQPILKKIQLYLDELYARVSSDSTGIYRVDINVANYAAILERFNPIFDFMTFLANAGIYESIIFSILFDRVTAFTPSFASMA